MKSTEIFKKNSKKIIKENDNLNDFSEFLMDYRAPKVTRLLSG